MNYQNGQTTGAKWFFFLTMVILLGAVALGFNLKDAKWLNREIASATANQMNVATDIDRQQAELDLQVRKMQTEIQITQMRQQAEYAAEKQQQELNDAAMASQQWANFQTGLYNTITFGILVVMMAVGISLAFIGIHASTGIYKILNAKAQSIQHSQPQTVVVHKYHRQLSPAAQKARQRERVEREANANQNADLFSNSKPIWMTKEDGAENLKPGNLPLAV